MTTLEEKATQYRILINRMPIKGDWFFRPGYDHLLYYPLNQFIDISYTKDGKKVNGLAFEYIYNSDKKQYSLGLVLEIDSKIVLASCKIDSVKTTDGSEIILPPLPQAKKIKSKEIVSKNISFKAESFSIRQHIDFGKVESFVNIIVQSQVQYKPYFNKFKAMTSGFNDWTQISEKKFNNLNILRKQFESEQINK